MTADQRRAPGVADDSRTSVDITIVSNESQVQRLLPLMRQYCEFYRVAPPDESLLSMARALVADPRHEGMQLLATDGRTDVGFATLFWSWETTISSRIGVMNDLYVIAAARGRGVSSALIDACLQRCREHGASRMVWQTEADNHHAQAVYDHIGGTRERMVDYWLDANAVRGDGEHSESR
jgi:GNAT superfamily N-acetyltransferase